VLQCLLVCGLAAVSKAGVLPQAAQYTLNYDNHLGSGTYVAAAPAVAHYQTITHQQYQQQTPVIVAHQPQRVHAVAPAYTSAVFSAPAPVAAIPAVPANHYVDYYVSNNTLCSSYYNL
jgi:hypothetical protein